MRCEMDYSRASGLATETTNGLKGLAIYRRWTWNTRIICVHVCSNGKENECCRELHLCTLRGVARFNLIEHFGHDK